MSGEAGPLADLRVVELTHVVAGPYTGLQLAYYGAEVIKVESRTRPDIWRIRDGDRNLDASVPFADHNKNKRSVTIDLKTARGRELVKALVARSDALVENFSYGVLERLGLGYDDLRAVRADLVMLSLQGFGRSGPHRDFVSLGPSLMACCGMSWAWTDSGEPVPVGSQTSYPDYVVSVHGALALLAALEERDRTGRGCHIDLGQADATVGLIAEQVTGALLGARPGRGNHRLRERVPCGVYRCAGTDRWCYLEVRTEEEWRGLVRAVAALAGLSGAAPAERLARREEIDAALSAWTRRLEAREAMERLQAEGVPAGMVADGRDLVEDRHLRTRGFARSTGHPVVGEVPLPGPAARHRSSWPRLVRHAPLLGQDTEGVLTGVLGLSRDEVAALAADGVL